MSMTPISLINSINAINSINSMISSNNALNSSQASSQQNLINSLDLFNTIDPLDSAGTTDSAYSLNLLNPINSLDKSNQTYGSNNGNDSSLSFADILQNMMNDTNQTNAQTQYDAVNLALGLTSDADLQNIQINAIKADLALRTMISVRNKALDAYTEIMRMNV